MNAEQLNAIKERAAKATPGPWYHNRHNEISTPNGARLAQAVTGLDAEFIAHAREDVPALVAEVERLRKEISFIAHVDKVPNAHDTEHLATSVTSWALNVLNGINHDNTVADWYDTEESE